jgi:predicted  nucleic acid-binding Zn-ribbon protein
MTSTRYLISRIARALGIHRRNQRMSDAAAETHLLREAEVQLGAIIWERVENIESLAADYWNLRKLSAEHKALAEKITECQERLGKAHEERSELLNISTEPELELAEEKNRIVAHLNQLAIRRDEVLAAAKEIRRTYEGLKVKAEVLSSQGGGNEIEPVDLEKIKSSLVQLKTRFSALKAERTQIASEIQEGDDRISEIAARIKELKKDQYAKASKAFQIIGDANKDISTHRAEIGIIETRMIQLQGVIGRHVSRNVSTDPLCAEAARNQQGLVEVMRALRKSITLNHKLVEN